MHEQKMCENRNLIQAPSNEDHEDHPLLPHSKLDIPVSMRLISTKSPNDGTPPVCQCRVTIKCSFERSMSGNLPCNTFLDISC